MANAGATIRVELIHSAIGFDRTQKLTLQGMGLRRRHAVVELADTPSARGQIYKVRHLVRVLEGKPVAKANPWKGTIVVPGPRTEAKSEKKAKAAGAKKKGKKPSKK